MLIRLLDTRSQLTLNNKILIYNSIITTDQNYGVQPNQPIYKKFNPYSQKSSAK
jgi:hypothetical protein